MKIKLDKKRLSIYLILRAMVIITMIAQILNGNYSNVFICILTLILFMVPSLIEKKLNIELPNTLEVIILLFIFAAEILGEIQEYYVLFDHWDDMLHTINGFLCAAIGFSLVDILNRSERIHMDLSPLFVALVAFSFSMTVGVLWEFYEFTMDAFFGMDMQKDTWLTSFNSVSVNPNGANVPIRVQVENISVNGEAWPAYLDIGLIDTMNDLWVNFLGAITFSAIGLIYIKNRGGKFAERFMPKMKVADDSAKERMLKNKDK
ncbi:MAG: hypothetical protein ACK5MV_13995 [Aminipila sp.]